MATLKKLVHFEAIIDASAFYDFMLLAEGKAIAGSVHFKPVVHGGEDEKTGTIKSAPSIPQFISDYVAEHPSFTLKELNAAQAAAGFNFRQTSISSAVAAMAANKVLKNTGHGAYAVRTATPTKKKAPTKKGTGANAHGSATLAGQVLALLKRAPEDGMQLGDIRKSLEASGQNAASISPTLTMLYQSKHVLRPEPGVYRISAAGARLHDNNSAAH